MEKLLIISSILFVMTGCRRVSKTEQLKLYFTNDSCKYWITYFKNPNKPYSTGFYICKDGSYANFIKSDSNERIFYQPFNQSKPIWRLISDSLLEFGEGVNFQIISYSQDSFILKNLAYPAGSNILRLLKEKDQQTRIIPKSLKDTIRKKTGTPDL